MCSLFLPCAFDDTPAASVLLSRKAKRKRKETGDSRYYAKADLERKSFVMVARVALLRPLRSALSPNFVGAI